MTIYQLRAVPMIRVPSTWEALRETYRQALPRLAWKRVGGLTFIRVGSLSMSFCISSK